MKCNGNAIVLAVRQVDAGSFKDKDTGKDVNYGSSVKVKLSFLTDGQSTEEEIKFATSGEYAADPELVNMALKLQPGTTVGVAAEFKKYPKKPWQMDVVAFGKAMAA